jgi:hypothetical protein
MRPFSWPHVGTTFQGRYFVLVENSAYFLRLGESMPHLTLPAPESTTSEEV